MAAKGKELKSPLIETITSDVRMKSVMSSEALRENCCEGFNKVEIADAINHIEQYLRATKPKYKKVGHGILSAIFYKDRDLFIFLGSDQQIFSYSLTSDTVEYSNIVAKIENIFQCFDDEKFLALHKKEVFICNSITLSTIKIVKFPGILGSCSYLLNKQFLYRNDSIFAMNLKSFSIDPVDIQSSGIVCMDNQGDSCWCIADKLGLMIINDKLVELSRIELGGIDRCKFSENNSKVAVLVKFEIQIYGQDLELLNRIIFQAKVTDYILDDKKQLLSVCTNEGEIITCDLRLANRKISQKLHKSSISNIFMLQSKQLTCGQDMRLCLTYPPKLKALYISTSEAISLAISSKPSQFFYITESNELKSSDYKESLTSTLHKFEDLSALLIYHNEKLYLNSVQELHSFDLSTNSLKSVQKPSGIIYTSINICSNKVVCGGASTYIYIYHLDLSFESKLLVHENSVTCLASYQKALVSGSLDKTVRVWDLRTNTNLHILSGHTGKITALFIVNGKIFSGSLDRSIKVWYIKTGDIIHTITGITGITKKILCFNSEFLLTCNHFGMLNYWSLKTYAKLFTSQLYGPIGQFDASEHFIVYSNKFHLFAFENPLFSDKIVISGPKEYNKYQTHEYFLKLICGKSPKFDSICDKWVIFPYILTPLHLYAYFNMPEHISKSILNQSSLVQSRTEQSPLSIAVSRDFEKCVSNIIKLLKPMLEFNPFLLNFISDRSLIEMNFTGHDSLKMFYNALFKVVKSDKLPRFIKSEVKLPIYAKSLGIMPKSQAFFPDNKIIESGQAVIYMRSLVKVSLIMGSSSSISLLQSIAECQNNKIFKTRFIQAYVESKWESVKIFMWVQFLIYYSYLFYFCLYLVQTSSNRIFLIIPLMLSCQLSLYEIYKAAVSGREYLYSVWNYIDAARAVLFLVFFGEQWLGDHDSLINNRESIDYYLLFLTVLSFVKGLSYFRLFESTRHFTQLLAQVLIDSYAFSIVLFYNTISFGFILFVSFTFDDNIKYFLGQSFLTNIALTDPTEYNITQWFVFAFGIAINNWVMMSVLISLYSETYDNFIEVAEIENIKILAAMSLEAERNIFWRRKLSQKSYLHICTDDNWREEKDPIAEKIKGVKKLVGKGIKKVGKMRNDILEAIEKNRAKDKKKKIKKEDIKKDAWEVFGLLLKGFSNNDVNKENTEKRIKKLMKII